MANVLRKTFKEKGYTLIAENSTNQVFVLLENTQMNKLKEFVSFGFWEKYDDSHTVVRFATSWGTTKEDINALCQML